MKSIISVIFLFGSTLILSAQTQLSSDTTQNIVVWKNKYKKQKAKNNSDQEKELGQLESCKLYPNPSDGQFQLEVTHFNEFEFLEIRNANGQHIWMQQLGSNRRFEFDFSHLDRGLYFLILQNERGKKPKNSSFVDLNLYPFASFGSQGIAYCNHVFFSYN